MPSREIVDRIAARRPLEAAGPDHRGEVASRCRPAFSTPPRLSGREGKCNACRAKFSGEIDRRAECGHLGGAMFLRLIKTQWHFLTGAALGALVGQSGLCPSGACVLISTWWGGSITGILLAALISEAGRPAP